LEECPQQGEICVMPAAELWPVPCAGRAEFSAADKICRFCPGIDNSREH